MKAHHIGKSRSAAAPWQRRALQVLSGAVLIAAVPLAHATVYTLQDLNSTLTTDSSTGITSWTVDGVNQLYQQWFWGRIGPSGGESSLGSALNFLHGSATDTNFVIDPHKDTLSLAYGDADLTNSSFLVTLKLSLLGGGTGSKLSDLGTQGAMYNKTLTFTNLTNTERTYHAFQYSDFDLGGNSANDTATATNANTIVQRGGGMILTDVAAANVTPKWEIGPFSSILASLNDGSPTTLSDSGSGMVGDVTYAREWDFTLQPYGSPNNTFALSLDQHISVPDPGTILLLGAGMLGLAGASRRKWRKNQSMDQG
mgnify:CR=1 FL=1